ncbi:MAG: hypothetical protein KC646_13235 [Candidatus Cloacimonetes bacterium]|nr:hypothetical protein [Candidatus Cloacimonadota bacterium]
MAYKEFNDINILKKEIDFQKKEKQKSVVILFITSHLDLAYPSALKSLSKNNEISLVIQVRGSNIGEMSHQLDPLNHDDKEQLIKHNINYFCSFDYQRKDSFQIVNKQSLELFGLQTQSVSGYLKTMLSFVQSFQVNRVVFLERHARQYYALLDFVNELDMDLELSLIQESFAENSLRFFHDHDYILSSYPEEIDSLSRVLNSVIKNCRGISKDLIKDRICERLEDEGLLKVSCRVYDPLNADGEFITKSTRFYLTLEIGGQLYVDDRSFIL